MHGGNRLHCSRTRLIFKPLESNFLRLDLPRKARYAPKYRPPARPGISSAIGCRWHFRPGAARSVPALAGEPHAAANRAAKGSEARPCQVEFFETKIRPVLAEHCYKCHAGERHKANLRLESLQGMLAGGDSGPAIVPGDAEHSLLMQVIGYSDDYVQMPPTKKLPDELIADLTRWVQMGAPWPGADKSDSAPPPSERPSRSPTRIGPIGSISRFAGRRPPRIEHSKLAAQPDRRLRAGAGWKPKGSSPTARPASGH